MEREWGGAHCVYHQEASWARLVLVPAVRELWNAWEIHSLILVSLFLQIFLFLFAGWRRRSTCFILSMVLWLAYLSADTVAVFVLGHLAVRASEPHHQLMAFWAPFVLVHLGGQDNITAFARQDTDLWGRHLLNLVTQVAVAGYVVGKASWPDRRIWAAMVLMFITGCYKYAERTLYLYFASLDFMNSTISWRFFGHGKNPYKDTRANARELMAKTLKKMSKGESGPRFMESFDLTTNIMAGDAPLNTVQSITAAEKGELHGMLQEFRSCPDRHNAYDYVGALLVHCYRRLYTKAYVRELCTRRSAWVKYSAGPDNPRPLKIICLLGLTLFPYVATPIALALFAAAEKGAPLHSTSSSSSADVWVSYLLLVGAIVLEVSSVAKFMFSRFCSNLCSAWCKKQWSEQLGQYNMIKIPRKSVAICRRLKLAVWHRRLWGVPALPGIALEFIGWDVKHRSITLHTKKFILDSLLDFGARQEWNIASTRGQLALRKWTTLKALEESVRSGVDFPTSVLIWHIATDLCFSHKEATTNSNGGVAKTHKLISKRLSNYIMYLVFKRGVMLTTNSKVDHNEVQFEIVRILSRSSQQVDPGDKHTFIMELFPEEIKVEHEESKEQDEVITVEHEVPKEQDEAIQIEHEEKRNQDDHLKKVCQSAEAIYSRGLLRRARGVAQELISIEDEDQRWELIAKVWAEMLYYTAPRCGAAFHYQHLSTGGEFITHVFVLMYLLGPFMPTPGA
ncbi:hypothetical protein ACP70R_004076 [Stipagrostis hirtigluma subsp. patula]